MLSINELHDKLKKAIAFYWHTREKQSNKQKDQGTTDQGARSAVTGGAQMDGIITLLTEIIIDSGIPVNCIYHNRFLQLPGFFRPTKEWDLLVVKNGQLLLALEAKSQVGPSFGNNFNNRTEEAMGSALDLWTAFREGAFNSTIKPWLGWRRVGGWMKCRLGGCRGNKVKSRPVSSVPIRGTIEANGQESSPLC